MKEYGDNIAQLEIEKRRLIDLKDEAQEILQKYFPGSKSIDLEKDINAYLPGGNMRKTPVDDYIIELQERGLYQKIEKSMKRIKQLEERIENMRKPLETIQGIEKKIYKYMLEGLNVTKAVEKVAEEEEKSDRHIWRYYNKLKETLKKHNLDKKIDIFI